MTGETLLSRPPHVINLGLEVFAEALEAAGVVVVHVEWRPPAGDAGVLALLERLDDRGGGPGGPGLP
jgi:hypothetical protein